MKDLAKRAGVHDTTLWRFSRTGRCNLTTLQALYRALLDLERETMADLQAQTEKEPTA